MAELDLQQQRAELAAERSGIATALLAIQRSLDKIEPAVSKMEPVLASLEPTVHELAAWRPEVDTAVGHLQSELCEIRAEISKLATSPLFSDQATTSALGHKADAPPFHTKGGDDHGLLGRGVDSSARGSVLGSAPLSSPIPTNGLMCEILWSDPQPQLGRGPRKRGVGLSFGADVTKRFLEDLVVRFHEVKDEGWATTVLSFGSVLQI